MLNKSGLWAKARSKKTKIKMTRNKQTFSFLMTLLMTAVFGILQAQEGYQLNSQQHFKVAGTSTLHDWDMESQDARGQATILIEDQQIKEISSLKVLLPVRSLESGNNRMDRTAYDAIDADDHEYVEFKLSGVRNISPDRVTATGQLTIAGEIREVTLRANYSVNGNSVQFEGEHQIKFSQFDVRPPRAMLGTIRTGDELDIYFKANFVPSGRAN